MFEREKTPKQYDIKKSHGFRDLTKKDTSPARPEEDFGNIAADLGDGTIPELKTEKPEPEKPIITEELKLKAPPDASIAGAVLGEVKRQEKIKDEKVRKAEVGNITSLGPRTTAILPETDDPEREKNLAKIALAMLKAEQLKREHGDDENE